MVDNLIEKNRTRRAVIKKLKELGLIFKAPTRKSLAAGASKHAWHPEHDKRLRELYDSHREDPGKFIALCIPSDATTKLKTKINENKTTKTSLLFFR